MKIPQILFRSVELNRSAINEDERTVTLTVSSDEPYQRSWGMEILDHSPACADMSRMKKNAPLLYNHSRDALLGKIISAETDGKRMTITAKFSRSKFAEEKWQDVKDGILTDASIGYEIDEMKLVEEKSGADDVYRVTKWRGYEGSLVTIAADTSVGVGRTLESDAQKEIVLESKTDVDNQPTLTKSPPTKPPTMPDTTPAEPKIVTDTPHNDTVAAYKGRCSQIDDFVARTEKQPDWHREVVKIAAKHKSGDAVFDTFVTEANLAHPGQKHVETVGPVGMNQREVKAFSFLRAIHSLGTGRGLMGLEKEASDAHGKLIGADCGPNSFFVPMDVQRGGAFPGGITPEQLRSMDFTNPQTRALFTNVFSGAGAFVGTDLMGGSLIELLRNQMLTVQMGARTMSGLTGSNIAIPRQTGGATASWLAEDSTITATQQTVGQLNLSPHKLAAATAFTEQFAMQTSVDAENFVRQDLMAVTAIARDLAAIAGTGVSGQPIGILNLGSANLSTPVTLSAAQSMTYANAVKFELNVSLNNANRGKLGYMTSPTVKNNAKLIAEISSTNSNPVWKDDRVNGYPALATNQIPTGTSVIFGNWDDLILVDFAQSNFLVDPYSLSLQGQIRVINRLYCDNGVRHGTSFAVATN